MESKITTVDPMEIKIKLSTADQPKKYWCRKLKMNLRWNKAVVKIPLPLDRTWMTVH